MSTRKVIVTGSHDCTVRTFFFDEKPDSAPTDFAAINGSSLSPARGGGTLAPAKELKLNENPTWVEKHPYLKSVFYANGAAPHGKMYAVQLDATTGAMEIVSESDSGGAGPCHMVASKDGTMLFVAHYVSGHVSVLPLSPKTGHFLSTAPTPAQILTLTETSGVHARQHEPHPHQIIPLYAAGSEFPYEILVPDLGADVIWRLTWKGGWKVAGKIGGYDEGSGPRHIVFHPDGKHLYTLNEITATVSVHSFAPPSESSQILSTLSLIPPDYPAGSEVGASELLLVPPSADQTRQLLICSNRETSDSRGDTLAIFSVSTTDGSDIKRADEPWFYGCGFHLRGMKFDEAGELLGVVARNGGGLSVFKREADGLSLQRIARLLDFEMGTDVLWF